MELITCATAAVRHPSGATGWVWFVNSATWGGGILNSGTTDLGTLVATLAALSKIPRDHPLHLTTDATAVRTTLTRYTTNGSRQDAPTGPHANIIEGLDRVYAGRDLSTGEPATADERALHRTAEKLAAATAMHYSTGQPIQSGPGWPTRPAPPGPDIPSAPCPDLSAPRQPVPTPRRTTAGPSTRTRPNTTGYVGWDDEPETIRRVTGTDTQPKAVLCDACNRPINPLTFECRGCSD